jgi:hypothetical protein
MLTAAVRILGTAFLLLGTMFAQPATAEVNQQVPPKPEGDYVLVCSHLQTCWWILRSVAEGDATTTQRGKKPAKQTKPECQFGGAAQACTSDLGNWSNSQQCYMQNLTPQPAYSDPAWKGHTDGRIWACVREQGYDEGKHLVTKWVWLPGAPDTVVVDPVTLAYQAIAEMKLAAPLVRTAPGVGEVGLVNMPVWLWVGKTDNTWGPIERSASVPGLSVTATAHVTAVDWSLGDGNTVRCAGAGTPYDKAIGVKDSPDCGHRYKKTSSQFPKCQYPVTATAQWTITWQSTMGDTGEINLTQQAATQLRIGEAVPVLVDPDGGSEAPAEATSGC